MSDQLIVEREGLSNKDKGELQAIVSALGGTSNARMRKADLIDQILELSGASGRSDQDSDSDDVAEGSGAEDAAESDGDEAQESEASDGSSSDADSSNDDAGRGRDRDSDDRHPTGPDGEPLADWEIKVLAEGGKLEGGRGQRRGKQNQGKGNNNDQQKQKNNGRNSNNNNNNSDDDDANNRRSRRRGRGRGRDRDDAGNDPVSAEPIQVEGYLDLRDEGYAFLRVNGCLPSRHDAYVSVKQVRQFGLRKGDHLTGLSRPANRNEKNPALQQLSTVNGKSPEQAKDRPRFDKLTPVFPDERLSLDHSDESADMTSRIVDLVAPMGKGQRGLILSPPGGGQTSVIRSVATAIEANHPEAALLVLLIDERPEEVTAMSRHLSSGEVVSSTFDRPPEEHTAVAELTLERAKRLAEDGRDVVLLVDGVTRLARAYNMSAQQSGRVLAGGADASALYPPKRFLGAARNLEEGGSLTILASALVDSGSTLNDVILEEFQGTANMVLWLDPGLAVERIFPAIDLVSSSTRNEELLRDEDEIDASEKLRNVVEDLNSEADNDAAGLEMVVERLAEATTNADFLSEIATMKA